MTEIPRLVVAGAASGVGKTIVTTAIIAALVARGLRVQPFKAGPDYIDPGYHSRAAGLPSRNLDPWLVPPERLVELFARAAADADIAVIEGVMGLHDGRADTLEGSTAELARLLDAPVVLVLDVAKQSRTAAAVALGLQRFDPAVRTAGVILNHVASEAHLRWSGGPIEGATGMPVLGHLPRQEELALPERHLGLIPVAEERVDAAFFGRLADEAERRFDLERLLAIARSAPTLASGAGVLFPETPLPPRTRIAVARDEAFSFAYQDNLDLLAAWGAELIPFSPLRDAGLPPGSGGVLIGGGFPELYARELAANRPLHAALRAAAARGVPIYAECGGLMYLCREIVDAAGAAYPQVGLVPARSLLDRPRVTLGYRTAVARRTSILLGAGERVRGHEFHWSRLEADLAAEDAAYDLEGVAEPRREGFARGSLLASYLHLHFASDPRLAPRLVNACAAGRPG